MKVKLPAPNLVNEGGLSQNTIIDDIECKITSAHNKAVMLLERQTAIGDILLGAIPSTDSCVNERLDQDGKLNQILGSLIDLNALLERLTEEQLRMNKVIN